ncbi:MAG: cytochrome b/b6 domain-containing protein [Deltaproteobacteria bacterium]|nr:cytochrome b/b6 domain-containing protein [Deltaproteobacteria bacterium]
MTRIKRFSPIQRLFHLALMLSFAIQAVTGVVRIYISTEWGQSLASLMGGYSGALEIHKYVGLFMLFLFVVHAVYLLWIIDWRRFPRSIYGPDSILPRLEDLDQMVQHSWWLIGKAQWPRLDRWSYWEKMDYFGVVWGMVIIGSTGLILFWPTISSLYMPGWGLNIALWIHRIEAFLAMGHVFIIHFFIGHLRRENFPMDLAMFEGSVDLEKTRHERPAWVARMEQQGKLNEGLIQNKTSLPLRAMSYAFGFTIVSGCLYLLINALLNAEAVAELFK